MSRPSGTSRLNLAEPAVRKSMPAKIMMTGPQGCGKTRMSMVWAQELAGPDGTFLFIDTERERALLYADDFVFTHLAWDPPFDPDTLAATVAASSDQHPVIVVDSVYHFWSEEGGVRDIADRSGPRGNTFAGWKDARPAHRRMVEALMASPAHVILCCRSKVDYVQEQDETGRKVIRKVGMAAQTDEFFPSEVDVHIELDVEVHSMHVAKSRIKPIPQGETHGPDDAVALARTYLEWTKGGEPPAEQKDVQAIRSRMAALEPPEFRAESQKHFIAHLGRPQRLRKSRVPDAYKMVEQFEKEATAAAETLAPATAPAGGRRRKNDDVVQMTGHAGAHVAADQREAS